MTIDYRDLALDYLKSEDPAKMTMVIGAVVAAHDMLRCVAPPGPRLARALPSGGAAVRPMIVCDAP